MRGLERVADMGAFALFLVRVTVHVLDRSEKQITDAEQILRLVPTSARKISRKPVEFGLTDLIVSGALSTRSQN